MLLELAHIQSKSEKKLTLRGKNILLLFSRGMWGSGPWGPPPPGLAPDQMMQMMQAQGWMQSMQVQQMAQQAGQTATGPPSAKPSAAPAPAEAPAPLISTTLVLVTPASNDGDLVRAKGQRTSVPIKVELDGAREPTGSYASAKSLREKAGLSFPLDGSGWSWKLYVGQMVENQPSDLAIVVGDTDVVSDASWREIFSCKMIDGLKPVVFAQPCLAGHEGRDVDRKRTASMALQTDKAEAEAAATMLSNARPAKHGKGPDGASVRSGKAVMQLGGDAKLKRLRAQLKIAVDMSQTAKYLHPHDSKPIFILTDGVWAKSVFTADRSKLVTPGFYREISLDAIDDSFLNDDGTLKRGTLHFACRCCPPSVPPQKAASAKAPSKFKVAISTTAVWQKSEVTMETTAGGHKSATKAGGIILKSFQATVKYHHDKFHSVRSISAEERQEKQARFFAIGAAMLQQPAMKEAMLQQVASQNEVEQPSTLTPADPPDQLPIVLRYPFNAPTNAKERDVAERGTNEGCYNRTACSRFYGFVTCVRLAPALRAAVCDQLRAFLRAGPGHATIRFL